MDPHNNHSHQEPYGQGLYQQKSQEPQLSGVYSYNSNVVTGQPSEDTSERFLRYIPNKQPLSAGQVSIDVNDTAHDKDARGLDKARGGRFD